MLAKVQKWGNSQGVRLSRNLLDEAHLAVGDEVEVTAREGVIVLSPIRRVRGRVSLEALIAGIPADYEAHEVDWGRPEGREAW